MSLRIASMVMISMLACGHESTSTAAAPDIANATGQSALHIATLPFASAAERQARIQSASARLGSVWNINWYSAERLYPSSASRREPLNAGNKTKQEAESIASSFLATNADLFGLTPADLSAMSFNIELVGIAWVGKQFSRYSGAGMRTTAGWPFLGFLAACVPW